MVLKMDFWHGHLCESQMEQSACVHQFVQEWRLALAGLGQNRIFVHGFRRFNFNSYMNTISNEYKNKNTGLAQAATAGAHMNRPKLKTPMIIKLHDQKNKTYKH